MSGVTLLTGATGFVGRALLTELLASGVAPSTLRCLVRRPDALAGFGLPASSLVVGDLAEGPHLAAACRDVTLCYHVAGAIRAWNLADFVTSNATGTANLVEALEAQAPGARFVHVSSLAAAGPSRDGLPSAAPAALCRPPSAYGESKRRGELALAASRTLRWIVVRPPVVYGPGDSASAFLLAQATGLVCTVPWRPRPLSVIHVRDVVRALRLAAAAEAVGLAVPLDGPERFDTDSLMQALAGAVGRRARLLHVPLFLARVAAWPAELWARLRGRPGLFSRDKVREIAAEGWVADPMPARVALGFEARIRAAEGFRELAGSQGSRRA